MKPLLRLRTNFIVVHCSASPPTSDLSASAIRAIHVNERKFSDIGYHYVIRRNGDLEAGRPENQVGAHVQGFNNVSIGICLVGGINARGAAENNFTEEQFFSLHVLLEKLQERYPQASIVGHRDLSPDKDGDGVVEKHEWLKSCPCFDVAMFCRESGLNPFPVGRNDNKPVT